MTALVASKPARLSQKAVRLLDMQFWRWGCDVKHPTGNLLVRFGFRRIPSPVPDSSKTSVYVLEDAPSIHIVLRGSAAFYGKDRLGGLLLRRFDSQPYRTPSSHLEELPHTPNDLPPLERYRQADQQCPELTRELFCWIAKYEAWIAREVGIQHVEDSLELWGKRPVVEAAELEGEWLKLADQMG